MIITGFKIIHTFSKLPSYIAKVFAAFYILLSWYLYFGHYLLHFRTPPSRVMVRATVKLSAVFFHDESSKAIGEGGTKV